jgi:hypothetical protein
VIVGPLDEIFQVDAPFAAVRNHNGSHAIEPEFAVEWKRSIGWDVPDIPYVNGGIVLSRSFGHATICRALASEMAPSQCRRQHFDQHHSTCCGIAISTRMCCLTDSMRKSRSARERRWGRTYGTLGRPKNVYLEMDLISLRRFLSTATCRHVRLTTYTADLCVKTPLDALISQHVEWWDFLPANSFEAEWLSGRQRVAIRRLIPARAAKVNAAKRFLVGARKNFRHRDRRTAQS